MFIFNFPYLFDKSFPSEVAAVFAFGLQFFFYNGLSGNTCMIGSGNPKGFVPFHTVVTDNYILQGFIKGMAYMENARNIGRRNDDSKCIFCVFLFYRAKALIGFPKGINTLFKFFRIIRFFQFNRLQFFAHCFLQSF